MAGSLERVVGICETWVQIPAEPIRFFYVLPWVYVHLLSHCEELLIDVRYFYVYC